MNNVNWKVSVPVILVAALIAIVWVREHREPGRASLTVLPVVAKHVGRADHVSQPDNVVAAKAAPSHVSVGEGTFIAQLAHSADYFDLAQRLETAAAGGNAEAQYALSQALSYCDDGYRIYFIRNGKTRTLDEATIWAATRLGMSSDEAAQIFKRCAKLMQNPGQFGAAATWLDASAKQGYPLAQIALSQTLFTEARQRTASGGSGKSADELRAEANGLINSAVRSKEPAVLWKMGDLQAAINGNVREADTEQWVWRVAACDRGYDCSDQAAWHQFGCRFDTNCQPGESGLDYIQRATEDRFELVKQKARELNEKIDSGEWEATGLKTP